MDAGVAVTAGTDRTSRRWRRYTAVASRPLPTLSVAALLLLAATQLPFQTSHLATAAQGPLFGIASGLILATFVQGGWTRRSRGCSHRSVSSRTAVYLWHWVILSTLIRHEFTIVSGTGLTATGVRVVALVSLALPVATLSWLLIERPLLRRTAGWERRMNAREAAKPRALAGRAQAPLPASTRP